MRVAPDIQRLAQKSQEQHQGNLRHGLCRVLRLNDLCFPLTICGGLWGRHLQLQKLVGDGSAVAGQVGQGVKNATGNQGG